MKRTAIQPADGILWVCPGCGKFGPTPMQVGDESCYMHAVPCRASSVELTMDSSGRQRVLRAKALTELEEATMFQEDD